MQMLALRRFYTDLMKVVLIGVSPAGAEPVPTPVDPVEQTVLAYQRELAIPDGERHGPQRNQWRQEWRDRLVRAVDEFPTSPHATAALAKAIGLSNSIPDYERSRVLVERLLTLRQDDGWQERWNTELGSILMLSYRAVPAPEVRGRAIACFRLANQASDRLIASALKRTNGNRASLAVRERYRHQVLNYAWIGALSTHDPAAAADAFLASRNALLAGQVPLEGALKDYDAEYLLKSEMVASLASGQGSRAESLLVDLVPLARRHPMSYYARLYAERRFGSTDLVNHHRFLADWIDQHPLAEGEMYLLWDAAAVALKLNDGAAAAWYLERLLSDHREEMRQRDALLANASSGMESSVLLLLLEAYRAQRRPLDHERISRQFVASFPNHPLAKSMSITLDQQTPRQDLQKSAPKNIRPK